jgi:hypothetical protein
MAPSDASRAGRAASLIEERRGHTWMRTGEPRDDSPSNPAIVIAAHWVYGATLAETDQAGVSVTIAW